MSKQNKSRHLIGFIVTILIWFGAYNFEELLKVPAITVSPVLRIMFMSIFLMDALYLLIAGTYYIWKNRASSHYINQGPFQYIRYPIHSACIFSFTGLLAMMFYSWTIIISVVPLSIMWSWLVQSEEIDMLNKFGTEYKSYMNQTGQFLPSWRAMVESTKVAK